MFEDYLHDSHEFFKMAQVATNEIESRRYYRAAVFCAAGAMEAFVNYQADSLEKSEKLPTHEINFLTDKVSTFSVKDGLSTRTEYHKIDDKIKLILMKFCPDFDCGTDVWMNFIELKKLRDNLIHPRNTDDETPLHDYKNQIKLGITSIIKIMDRITKGMFQSPLRRKLIDLIPE